MTAHSLDLVMTQIHHTESEQIMRLITKLKAWRQRRAHRLPFGDCGYIG
jgi:hypothetical protein